MRWAHLRGTLSAPPGRLSAPPGESGWIFLTGQMSGAFGASTTFSNLPHCPVRPSSNRHRCPGRPSSRRATAVRAGPSATSHPVRARPGRLPGSVRPESHTNTRPPASPSRPQTASPYGTGSHGRGRGNHSGRLHVDDRGQHQQGPGRRRPTPSSDVRAGKVGHIANRYLAPDAHPVVLPSPSS